MLAGAARGNTVKLWGVATGENIATFSGHKDWISTVAFSPDGTTLVSGSGDGTIKLVGCCDKAQCCYPFRTCTGGESNL